MRRTLLIVPILVGLALAGLNGSDASVGYKDVGFDANEPSVTHVDVRSSARRVWRGVDGRRRLEIKIRGYGDLYSPWSGVVRLDSGGGPRADYRLELDYGDMSDPVCWLRSEDATTLIAYGVLRRIEGGIRCRVPLGSVRPDKRIRWKVHLWSWVAGDDPDYAPSDHGWYPQPSAG